MMKNILQQIVLEDPENFEKLKKEISKRTKVSDRSKIDIVFTCPYCKRESHLSATAFLKRESLICRACKQSKSLSAFISDHKEEWVSRWKDAVQSTYGVDNIAKHEETQNKKKQTCLAKYGSEYAIASPEVREKIVNTFQEKFNGNSPWCSSEIQAKILEDQRKQNGGKLRVQTEEFRKKVEATCMKKFGHPYAGGTQEYLDKRHKTNLEKYGVEESWQSDMLKSKRKETMLQKYGVEYSMQDPERRKEILQNRYDATGHMYPTMKGYRYDDKNFDSSYELAYYIWLRDTGQQFIYHPGTPLSYIGSDGKEHEYLPDFLINGQFYEIKGDQFFNEKNEPWDPYRKIFWWEKYNSLLENNVIILRDKDLKHVFEYVNKKYGKIFLKECKSKKESAQ